MSPSTPKTPQTLLFKNALGVFQGGGCRGAALAGAYSAAVACGVHLSKVAGTSAGSLMAALIGAGASPEFVIKALTDVKFSNFMKVASGPKIKRTFSIRVLNFLIDLGAEEKWGRALRRGGMYTSEYIQEWVEELLVELLPGAKRPITFQSLPKPTFIIAADLLSSGAKIWSKEGTPEDSVALAVRASCSIPVFFQPVSLGNNRYVDGGVLSNSPTFVFADRGVDTQIQEPVLAFNLKGDYADVKDWSLEEMASRLAGVVVDGGIEIQSKLHQNVHSIVIPTYDLQATDFAKMNDKVIKKLVEDGEKAATNFIATELSSHTIEEYSSNFYHQEEIFRAVVKYRASLLDHVAIAQHNTRWFWSIFPVVLAWRMAGVRVDVLANHYPDTTSTEGRQEVQRRTLLRGIGVNFSEAEILPIKGYILKGKSVGDGAAIVETMDAYGDKPIATFYSGYADSTIIELAFEKLCNAMPVENPSTYVPTIKKYEGDFEMVLKQSVSLYRNGPAVITLEKVQTQRLQILTPLIREYKIRQIDVLTELILNAGFELFEPLEVVLSDGRRSVVTPPVVEEIGGDFYVIEGNTRSFQCGQNRIREFICAVVRNVQKPLPRDSFPLSHAQITAHNKNPHLKHRDLFRPIEESLHPI